MPLRFDVDYNDPTLNYDLLIDEVFGELQSAFIEMPKGEGFIEYAVFEQGYQALKRATDAFTNVTADSVMVAVREVPIAFIVFRSILGFTPPEWAQVTSEMTGFVVEQGPARAIDRKIRLNPLNPWKNTTTTDARVAAMVNAGVQTLLQGTGVIPSGFVHRLDKVDTRSGLDSLQSIADLGIPYAILLYERFLGRPFASHRDSVSELVGEVVEVAIKNTLSEAKVSYRETTRVEKIPGFDQRPDFFIPDEFSPVALIEAKLTQDDGTARDKVARVQRLRTLRDETNSTYDVIACIAGRGFKIRRDDMRRMLKATDGKVFTLTTIHLLIDQTRIREYRVR